MLFNDGKSPANMEFEVDRTEEEALWKTLDSFSSEELNLITVIYIYKAGAEQPIVVHGPFGRNRGAV